MENNNFDEILNQLELINSKLDDVTLDTNKYINDFDKLKEIINEKLPNTEDEKLPNTEDEILSNTEDEILSNTEDKEFKKIYKSHSNFTEESINNASSYEPAIYIKPNPRVEISETGDITHIFDVEINLQKAIDNLNNKEVEYNLKNE
jgi:hypothetical protein